MTFQNGWRCEDQVLVTITPSAIHPLAYWRVRIGPRREGSGSPGITLLWGNVSIRIIPNPGWGRLGALISSQMLLLLEALGGVWPRGSKDRILPPSLKILRTLKQKTKLFFYRSSVVPPLIVPENFPPISGGERLSS